MSQSKKGSSARKEKRETLGQMTQTGVPNRRLTGKQLTIEMGGSGTNLMNGIIEEDYNGALLGTIGLEIYDRMRKSDAQVHATLLYCELPILSTKWKVNPAKNDEGESEPEDEEIAQYVRKNIFEWMDTTFPEFLREILTMLPFGHSVFEPVWAVDKEDGMIWLKKMGWRKQTTIQKWETEDGAAGITQQMPDGKKFSIPADKLVIFTLRREGDNYAGQSILRTAYRHWYLKDRFYRFDSVKHERQSLGMLRVRLPVDATPEDESKALSIIAKIRNIEQAGITLPGSPKEEDGWDADFMDMKGGTVSDLSWSINHHDRKLATNILAQFMELGSDGGGGSYALSEDQSSMFLNSVSTLANYIREVLNRHLIQKLVDYNFETDRYPTLEFDKLGDTKITDYTSALSNAAGAGMLTPDDGTEAAVRERLSLPPKQAAAPTDPLGSPLEGVTDEPEDPDEGDLLDGMQDEAEEDDDGETPELSENVDLTPLFFSEIESLIELGEEHIQEVYALAAGSVSSQTKQRISDALKAYWDRKGRQKPEAASGRARGVSDAKAAGKTPQTPANANANARVAARGGDTKALLQQKKTLVTKIEQTRTRINALNDRYAAAIDAAKSPAEKKKLRAEKKAILTPLRQMRTADIQTRVGVNKVLAARRKELQAKIKAIRAAVKEKRIDLKSAIEPLRAEVGANNAKIKELRAKKKGLKGEAAKAYAAAISGLLEDNQSIRDAAGSMRDDFAKDRYAAADEIDKTKQASGLFSEHVHPPDGMFYELSSLLTNETIIQLQNEIEPLQLAEAKKKGLRTNDYERKAWRPLSLAERKVNFSFIAKSMEQGTASLNDKFTKAIQRARASLVDQVKFAVKYNDLKALGKVAVPKDVMKSMSKALTDVQKEMFEVGKRTAAKELDVPVPPTSDEIRGAMRVQNDAIAGKIAWNLEAVAVRAATEAIQKAGAGSITDTTQKAALDAVNEAIDSELRLSEEQEESMRLCEASIDETIALAESSADTLSVTGSINMGRGSIFARYPERVYGFQFSAILDDRTSAICMSLDGLVVRPGSPEYASYSPPRHPHCRSIWVAIMMEETFKPDFSFDINGSIPKNKNAMNAPGMNAPVVSNYTSPKTVGIINDEIKDRTKKVAAYVESGTHPTRVQQHREKISMLKKGLEGAEVGIKKALVKQISVGDASVRTPTGFVYATVENAGAAVQKKGIPKGTVVSTAAMGGDGTLLRMPAGEAAKLKPKKITGAPAELQSFVIDNAAPADVIEVWDDVREEWIPARPRTANKELAEVMRGILMADGIRFAVQE